MSLLSSSSFVKPSINPYTLESLISGLDQRGMLVLMVLLGEHAMQLLTKDKIKEVTKSDKLIIPGTPNAEDIGKTSLSATS